MTPPPDKSRSPSPPPERCFCGAPQAPELEYYCSVKCAREDALNALTLGAPHTSDRPPTPPLPTLPPDFFKPPLVGRRSHRSLSSYGSEESFPHVDLGPFASLHPRSNPNLILPHPDVPKPGHTSFSSTKSSGSDKPQWKSHYRRLREKESLHSTPDANQRAFQPQDASAPATDDSIGSSRVASSSKGKLTQKMVDNALRGSFGQPTPTAIDSDFFESSPLQNPRKPMVNQSIKSSTVHSTLRQTSTTTEVSSALCLAIPPGVEFATQSPASRHRALGSAFGRSESSLDLHVTAKETPAALRQDVRVSSGARPSIEFPTVKLDNTAPLERPPPPLLPKYPFKGGATRLYLPLRRMGSNSSLSVQDPLQRLPVTTDVGLPPSAPNPASGPQPSPRPGIVVRQSVLLTKRKLPIGGRPPKLQTDLKHGHSRAVGVPPVLQFPVRETEVPKLLPLSGIKVEGASPFDAKSERSLASTRHRTMVSALPKTPSPNTLSSGIHSVSVTPRLTPSPTLLLRSQEDVTIVQEDGREMDEVSSPSTSECPVTPADSAFTLGDSQPHPSTPVEWGRSKQSTEDEDEDVFSLRTRFESGMDLEDEVTPIGENGSALALQRG
jgi:hypothetical protein